jgi:hypothetical protein
MTGEAPAGSVVGAPERGDRKPAVRRSRLGAFSAARDGTLHDLFRGSSRVYWPKCLAAEAHLTELDPPPGPGAFPDVDALDLAPACISGAPEVLLRPPHIPKRTRFLPKFPHADQDAKDRRGLVLRHRRRTLVSVRRLLDAPLRALATEDSWPAAACQPLRGSRPPAVTGSGRPGKGAVTRARSSGAPLSRLRQCQWIDQVKCLWYRLLRCQPPRSHKWKGPASSAL